MAYRFFKSLTSPIKILFSFVIRTCSVPQEFEVQWKCLIRLVGLKNLYNYMLEQWISLTDFCVVVAKFTYWFRFLRLKNCHQFISTSWALYVMLRNGLHHHYQHTFCRNTTTPNIRLYVAKEYSIIFTAILYQG